MQSFTTIRTVLVHRLHTVPTLVQSISHQWEKNGVGELLDPISFKTAWTDYQGLMVQKINDLVVGTPEESKTTQQLLIAHARDPLQAALFNYASMAHNNHHFFEAITTSPNPSQPRSTTGDGGPSLPRGMTPDLLAPLTASFGSLETFRSEFLATAEAMFGPGFVWLVNKGGNFYILNTYLAGSPYADAHTRMQSVDMNTQNVGSAGGLTAADWRRQTEVQNNPGSFGNFIEAHRRPGGIQVQPVLCVNTWQHVWLPQYGVFGKREYLERWWEHVNWGIVESRFKSAPLRKDNFQRK
ncbi:MAG: hypothetical protein M1820_000473 [Bogoriella megaspora]|nr:MAG: hypothetical protein M1820_000473 [Bogoriella megaspora]